MSSFVVTSFIYIQDGLKTMFEKVSVGGKQSQYVVLTIKDNVPDAQNVKARQFLLGELISVSK